MNFKHVCRDCFTEYYQSFFYTIDLILYYISDIETVKSYSSSVILSLFHAILFEKYLHEKNITAFFNDLISDSV